MEYSEDDMSIWYHICKPIFKLLVFLPFMIIWSITANTNLGMNIGFILYSIICSIPIYYWYEKYFGKYKETGTWRLI